MTKLRSLLYAAALALTAAAHADDSAYDAVQALLDAGQSKQAVKQAKQYLAQADNEQDVQMRFILAGALAASGNKKEAEKLLRQMCDDFPELAEPWNNLAVLHAAAGRLDEAAAALQESLRRNPDYATALENLGDVRVRQAYEAWQLAAKDAALRTRLAPHLKSLRAMTAQRSPAPAGKASPKTGGKTAAKDAVDKDSGKAGEKSFAAPPTAAKDNGKAGEEKAVENTKSDAAAK